MNEVTLHYVLRARMDVFAPDIILTIGFEGKDGTPFRFSCEEMATFSEMLQPIVEGAQGVAQATTVVEGSRLSVYWGHETLRVEVLRYDLGKVLVDVKVLRNEMRAFAEQLRGLLREEQANRRTHGQLDVRSLVVRGGASIELLASQGSVSIEITAEQGDALVLGLRSMFGGHARWAVAEGTAGEQLRFGYTGSQGDYWVGALRAYNVWMAQPIYVPRAHLEEFLMDLRLVQAKPA